VRDVFRLQTYYSKSRRINEKVVLTWTDLNYSVKEKDGKKSTMFSPSYRIKDIVKSAHGTAESGDLLALMGPSGYQLKEIIHIFIILTRWNVLIVTCTYTMY
jgi:hypothetical protein